MPIQKLKPTIENPPLTIYADNANNTTNIIKPKKDIRRIGDMPKDIREYYNLTDKDDNEKYDISNGCYFRVISRNKEYKSANF